MFHQDKERHKSLEVVLRHNQQSFMYFFFSSVNIVCKVS